MALTLPTDRCFVIAEAGTNHANERELDRFNYAMAYVEAAAEAKADAVKFQWFIDHTDMFCPLPGDEKRWPRWMRSVLNCPRWYEIKQYAEGLGLIFLASTFQHTTVAWLNELGVVATKVASRAAEKFPYKDAPDPFLISLGAGWPRRVETGRQLTHIEYLQCEMKYPSTARWEKPGGMVGSPEAGGFSDHSGTPWRAIDAISRGCKLIEVHYHLDERDAGPDLPASLTLDELKLVCDARDAFADLHKG